MRYLNLAATFLICAFLAGCGGGGAGGTMAGNDGGQAVSLGSIQARAQSGTPTPLLISNTVNLFAMSGATFTHVAYTPPRTLANTRIAFGNPGANLWTADPDGGHVVHVSTDMNPGGSVYPSWSPDALRILFEAVRTNTYHYFVVGATGYNVTQQSYNGYSADNGPQWCPTSNTVLYNAFDGGTGHYQLFTSTINGGAGTMLTNDAADHFGACWSPNGSKIAFVNGQGGDIITMNANATGQAQITSGRNFSQLAWSPDGTRFLAIDNPSSLPNQVALVWTDGTVRDITNGTTEYLHPTWSPDGKEIAFAHRDGSGTQQIWEANSDGSGARAVIYGSDGHYSAPSWSPFPIPRTMIGTGGLFGSTSKAGFIFSQSGDLVQSFLTFNAPTPGTTTVTTQANNGLSGSQLFQISGGGGINSLTYANDLLLAPITAIPGNGFSSATGVIVGMSNSDGHITLAMPYAKVSSKVQSKNGGMVYSGTFLGVFDGSGKNLAPGSASRVELSATGKFISAS